MKQTLKIIYAILLVVIFLVACTMTIPLPAARVTLTSGIPITVTAPASSATSPGSTPTVPPVTLTPTRARPGPTSTFPPVSMSSVPDGLRIAYIGDDGNLYLQNGGNPPIQLTHINSGRNSSPHFSDDGQRLIFTYSPELYIYSPLAALHSIHIDGTHDKVLITIRLLRSLGLGYNEFTDINSLAFVPGSHQLLFNTRQVNEEVSDGPYGVGGKKNRDLLSVNMDTGKIERLLPPGQGGDFVISPDGSRVAIQASGHIDVISIDGRAIHRNFVTYTPSKPSELTPDMFWTKDSSELIVALPVDTVYELRRDTCPYDAGPRSLWHYTVDSSTGIQTALHPSPIGRRQETNYFVNYSVSPDGNWILYDYSIHYGCPGDTTVPPGRYLGNLREGTAQFYAPRTSPVWSPDSIHFVYEVWDQGLFLGSVDRPSVFLDVPKDYLLGWADPAHYLAYYIDHGSVVGMMGEINGKIIYFPVSAPVSSLEEYNRYYRFDFIYLDR